MADPRAVDPEIAGILAALPVDTEGLSEATLPQLRRSFAATAAAAEAGLSDRVSHQAATVSGHQGGPDVTLIVHRPTAAAPDALLPCLLWMHGGGYVTGSASGDATRFDRWSPKLGCVGVSVDYRLAPEAPYPAPLEDCYAGLLWVAAHGAELGIDTTRIAIGGSSAGAGLAAGLALCARDRGEVELCAQLLIYPMLDDRQVTASSRWDAPVWPPASNTFGWRSYLGPLHGTEEIPGWAAAARASDVAGLPPTMIVVGTADGFLDEDVAYAGRLVHAGVPTDLRVYAGAPHGYDLFAPSARLSRRSRRDIEEWLAVQLGTASPPAAHPA